MPLVLCAAQDRKNALEEYIYEARDKIEGTWASYGTADAKEALKAASVQAEDWLYSDEVRLFGGGSALSTRD